MFTFDRTKLDGKINFEFIYGIFIFIYFARICITI